MGERYEIKGRIGQGGVGAVYEAYDTLLNRGVAIKRLLPEEESEVAEGGLGTDLSKEAAILSSLHHPNIITLYDISTDEEGPFVVMELIDGETIEDVVQRGAMTEEDFGVVVEQCLEALVAAQEVNLLHRDLKPTNIMVQWLGGGGFQLKILDFGLAKYSSAPAVQTVDHGGAILGSIYFLAPEQFERTPLDRRTDLYALGCVFYYCLTKEYPFEGESAPDVMMAHLEHNIRPLEDIRPDLSLGMRNWLKRLMSRQMEDRPESAQQALEEYRIALANPEATFGKGSEPPMPSVVEAEQAVAEEPVSVGTKSGRLIMGDEAPNPDQVRRSLTSRSVQTAPERGDTTSLTRPPLVASGSTTQTSRSVLTATPEGEEEIRNSTKRWIWIATLLVAVVGGVLGLIFWGSGEDENGGGGAGSLTSGGLPAAGLVAHYSAWEGVLKTKEEEAAPGDRVWGWKDQAQGAGTAILKAPAGVQGPILKSYNSEKIGALAGPTPALRFAAGDGLVAQAPGSTSWAEGITFCVVVRSADKGNPRALHFLSEGIEGPTAELKFDGDKYIGGVRLGEGNDPGLARVKVDKDGMSIITAVWDPKEPAQRLFALNPDGNYSPLGVQRKEGGADHFDQWVTGSRGIEKEAQYAGDIFELIIYNRPLEEEEVDVLAKALAERYFAKPAEG